MRKQSIQPLLADFKNVLSKTELSKIEEHKYGERDSSKGRYFDTVCQAKQMIESCDQQKYREFGDHVVNRAQIKSQTTRVQSMVGSTQKQAEPTAERTLPAPVSIPSSRNAVFTQPVIIALDAGRTLPLVDINKQSEPSLVSLLSFDTIITTKTDLRDDPSIACYTPEDGRRLKRKVKAQGYMECSALRCQGLDEIFVEAIRVFLRYKNKKPTERQCMIL
nr:unnamed protein product [Callosobruchus chinensis]